MKTTPHQQRSSNILFIIASAVLFLSAGLTQGQVQDRPKPGPEQKKLESRAGEWEYKGTVADTPLGPGGKFVGKTSAKMVLDGLFLETRDEDKGVYGGKEIVYKSVALSWYDPATKAFATQSYDNDGMVSRATSKLEGQTWTDSGAITDSKGKSYKSRTTTTMSGDNRKSVSKREISMDDGKTWMLHWESNATKVGN